MKLYYIEQFLFLFHKYLNRIHVITVRNNSLALGSTCHHRIYERELLHHVKVSDGNALFSGYSISAALWNH